MGLIYVVVIDDQMLVRAGIRKIVENTKEIKVAAESTNGIEALEPISIYKPDIILLDIGMPRLNGLDTLREIKKIDKSNKVIILSAYSNHKFMVEAIKLGANSYISKNCTPEDLISTIKNVKINGDYLEPSLSEVLEEIESQNIIDSSILSKREYEILNLISKGHSNVDIGAELFISEKTVKNHITNIFRKIEVENRVEAVIFAYENGLII